MNSSLAKYLPLVDFLAGVFGSDTEVVLHDVEDMERSVVAIRNGQISGRRVGSPATNVVLKIIKEGGASTIDFLVNYKGLAADGRALRSSTFLIHDDDKKLIGILCINIDTRKLEQLREYIDTFISPRDELNSYETVERFPSSVEELAFDSIEAIVSKAGVSPQRMSQEEKMMIVRKLNDGGIFLLKGAVSRVASRMEVSEPTIYRYLNTIKKSS